MINDSFTTPGELIGTSEEFTGKEGTYEKNGNVYSSLTGIIHVNEDDRSVWVEPKTSVPPVPEKGDEIIGRVRDVKDSIVLINIASMVENMDREIAVNEVGAIHVSNVSDDYVKDLSNKFRSGDIVRAKIIVEKPGAIDLTTNEPQLGVLSAKCSSCNGYLKRKSQKKLVCESCGETETRKISSEFGKEMK
ncbi:exosome complex RNA-binding protein Csl4 [Methanonatronarchaeum sp. AMET6-2]|uniref:exosome complex RNA-binding protein Csl4 n=1 Tax=Methanonatronarchaeum sp. AMET6-2 TaxID=2933293 RepID=UPI00122816E5|nr:exosome complex RNA-binding protein Csl4 [Methanonatronarchaeum sp. AMET6-2]RZN62105.1 MAG: RNA-binding protein [Methanonatronarchaeia archaeon]UOY10204.1 exosome complex RNA-binding protein Csl4 [Methanonatronarchaeum sp. AMET6-2]